MLRVSDKKANSDKRVSSHFAISKQTVRKEVMAKVYAINNAKAKVKGLPQV